MRRVCRCPYSSAGRRSRRDYAEDDLATLYKGPLLYCKDAFDGLHRMDSITGGNVEKIVAEQRDPRGAPEEAPRKCGEAIEFRRRRCAEDRDG